MPQNWGPWVRWGLQSASLINSFLACVFGMHIWWNLTLESSNRWVMVPSLLLPLVLNVAVLLPMIIYRLTIVEAFFIPNHDAIDSALEFLSRFEEDIKYLVKQWEAKGRPPLPDFDMGVEERELERVLRRMGLHISSARMHRLFHKFDKDNNGLVDACEFFDFLTSTSMNKTRGTGYEGVPRHASDVQNISWRSPREAGAQSDRSRLS